MVHTWYTSQSKFLGRHRDMILVLLLHILVFVNDVSSYDRLSNRWSFGLATVDYVGDEAHNVMDFGAAGDGGADDTKALRDAWNAACSNNGGNPTILFPNGKTFLVKVIEFSGAGCTFASVHFQIEGQIVAPASTDWTGCSDSWISFIGITGLTLDGNGLVNGHGEAFWASKKKLTDYQIGEVYDQEFDDCPRVPSALRFEGCINVQINHVNTKDTPGVHFSLRNCTQVGITNVNISAPEDSPNTDGINIFSSTNVIIQHTNIATGDDCIAINSGSSFFNITNVACGPGHGISVGSLGKDGGYASVEDIHVKDSSFSNTQNGARIKTWEGGSGYARRITFEGITLTNAGNPIFIDQHYCARSTCPGRGNSAVEISDISFINFRGTSADENAIQILCDKAAGCDNVILNDVDITPIDPKTPAKAACTFVKGSQTKTNPPLPCLSSQSYSASVDWDLLF